MVRRNTQTLGMLLILLFLSQAAWASQNSRQELLQPAENQTSPSTPNAGAHHSPPGELSSWTLDRLVNEAATGNPETLSKRAGLQSAEASVDSAFQQFFPTPYAQAQQLSGHYQSNAEADQRIGVVGIKQPIWTGGKLTADLAVARSAASSAGFSIVETQLSLAQRVVNAYQGLVQDQWRIQAQQEGIVLLEKYAATMKRRVQSSVSASVDQSLVDSRLSQARSDLSSFTAARQTILVQLSQLVGHNLRADQIEHDASAPLAAPPEPDGLVSQALLVHPSLRRLKADLTTVEHQVKQQRAALMPTLNLKAEYRSDLFREASSKTTPVEDTVVYASIDFSPGAGLSSLANIRVAEIRSVGAKYSIEATRRDLTAKVLGDDEDCRTAAMRYQLLKQNVQTSREVLDSYNRLFVAGKRSWLDVLNAARELTQGEIAMADMLALYRASMYRLKLDIGDTEWLRAEGSPPDSN